MVADEEEYGDLPGVALLLVALIQKAIDDSGSRPLGFFIMLYDPEDTDDMAASGNAAPQDIAPILKNLLPKMEKPHEFTVDRH